MAVFIICVILGVGIYLFLKKTGKINLEEPKAQNVKEHSIVKDRKEPVNEYGEKQFIAEIRNEFKFAIEKFKRNCMPEISKLAQLHPNPNKQQAINELAHTGKFDEIIKQGTMDIYDEILNLTQSIFTLANMNIDISEHDFLNNKKNGKNISLTTELQFEIMKEFRKQDLIVYNDVQLEELIKKLARNIENQLN